MGEGGIDRGVGGIGEIGAADVVEDFGEDLVAIAVGIFGGEGFGGGGGGIPAGEGSTGEIFEVGEEGEIAWGEVGGGAIGVGAGEIEGEGGGGGFGADRGAEGDEFIEGGAAGFGELFGPDGDAGEIGEGLFGGFAGGGEEELGHFEHFAGGIAFGDRGGEAPHGAGRASGGEIGVVEEFVDGGVKAIIIWDDDIDAGIA